MSFRVDDERSFGAVVEGRIVDLGRHLPEFDSLRALLEGNGLVRALDTAAEESASYRLDAVTHLPPLRHPDRTFCIFDDPESDPVLVEPPTIVGHGRDLPCPAGEARLWAGIGIVVGNPVEGPPVDRIAGLTLVTYLVPGGTAMGPWMVTVDELGSMEPSISIECGGQAHECVLPHLGNLFTRISASTGEDKPLGVGDLVAVLQQMPDPIVADATEISVSSPEIGKLTNPLIRQG
jgi:hypothetical protein